MNTSKERGFAKLVIRVAEIGNTIQPCSTREKGNRKYIEHVEFRRGRQRVDWHFRKMKIDHGYWKLFQTTIAR